MNSYSLQLPLSEEDILKLHAGDSVLLTGCMYTARDAAHKRMMDLLRQGLPLPFDITGQTVYYVGPAPASPGHAVGPAGPTTSSRMDPATPQLLDMGLKAVIGKGKRSQAVRDALIRNRAVYFAAIGGCAALQARSILSEELIAYPDLGTEAIRLFTVRDFPVFVAIDAYGESIYKG